MNDVETRKLADQLTALGKSASRHLAAAERDKAAIRELLPAARSKGFGPAELQRMIQDVFVAGTISRWTKDDAPEP